AAVLAIPVVSKVPGGLTRPEKIVRRRERGNRSRLAELGDDDPVFRLEGRLAIVLRAAEPVRLRVVRRIAPRDAGPRADRQSLEAAVVLVGDRVGHRARNDFLSNEVGALVYGELKPAFEDAE